MAAAAVGGALGAQGERGTQPRLLKMCHSHAGLGDRRNDWLRYGELEFPCAHVLQFILCIAPFVPDTLPGVYGNSQYFFCDAARGMWTASRTTTMASKTSTIWRTSTMGG